MRLEEAQGAMPGNWVSIAPEVRPSKNPDGTLKPFYLTRSFVYLTEDRFELSVTNYADPFGKAALAKIDIGGHMIWQAITRSRQGHRRSTSSPMQPMR
jgi:hypothetical protein